jgi:hypothetical protein
MPYQLALRILGITCSADLHGLSDFSSGFQVSLSQLPLKGSDERRVQS